MQGKTHYMPFVFCDGE